MEGETFTVFNENGQLNQTLRQELNARAIQREQDWNQVFNRYASFINNETFLIENITDVSDNSIEYVVASCEDDMSESQMSVHVESTINSVVDDVSIDLYDQDITQRLFDDLPVPTLSPPSFDVVNDKEGVVTNEKDITKRRFDDLPVSALPSPSFNVVSDKEGVVTNETDSDDDGPSPTINEEMINEFDEGKLTLEQIATFVSRELCEKELEKGLIREYVKEVNSTFTEEEVATVVVFIEHERNGRHLKAAAKALNSRKSRNDPTMYRKARNDMRPIVGRLLQYMSVRLLCLYGNFFGWRQHRSG